MIVKNTGIFESEPGKSVYSEHAYPQDLQEEDKSPVSLASASDEYCVESSVSVERDRGLLARKQRGWGTNYKPRLKGTDERELYRRILGDLMDEVQELGEYIDNGEVLDEASGIVAEIQNLLEMLYDCPFGVGESLKSAVVAVQSQLNNTQWTVNHVNFLNALIHFLHPRYVVNDQVVDEIFDIIEEFGLDPFRGTVSDSEVLVRYRIEKITDS